MTMEISLRRKMVNTLMLTLSGLCTLLVVSVLFFILGYLLYHGISSLNWAFFTQLPKPSGETGGGMANAISRQWKSSLARHFNRRAHRFSGRRLFGGIQRKVVCVRHSLYRGLTERCPVHRDWNCGVRFNCAADEGIFNTRRRRRAGNHDDSHCRAHHRGVPARSVPTNLREGAMALGATKAKTIFTVVVPAAMAGLTSGMMLNLARVAGETAPLLFTAPGEYVLEQRLDSSYRHVAGDDL